jgi:hypothetical protein
MHVCIVMTRHACAHIDMEQYNIFCSNEQKRRAQHELQMITDSCSCGFSRINLVVAAPAFAFDHAEHLRVLALCSTMSHIHTCIHKYQSQ